jgi:LL-diaminopimelate aminotransferase
MAKLNHHFTKLSGDYLFPEVSRRVTNFRGKNPSVNLLDLGIGDVARPLTPSVVLALETAAREMGNEATFKGYGPSQGYSFLREAIAHNDYPKTGITADEIFISDSAKSDLSDIGELFAVENRVAVLDPTFPDYVDSNVMAGRTRLSLKTGGYGGIVYIPCTPENHFTPTLPNRPCDIIYLSSPNNPTGIAMNKKTLEQWVAFARENQAIILFDGAYEAYIRTPECPRSIYEIEGAKEVAIEIRSFSKTAGFTGLCCAYMVIPHALQIVHGYNQISLNALWKRRQETKFHGVSYPVQRAALAVYSAKGREEGKQIIDSYLWQATSLRNNLVEFGFTVFGGVDAPYLWLQTPRKLSSWAFFDYLLNKGHIISIPGIGFGKEGEGYVRLSAFGNAQTIAESVKKFKELC